MFEVTGYPLLAMARCDVLSEKFCFGAAADGTIAFEPLLFTLLRKAFSLIKLETLLLRAPIVPLEQRYEPRFYRLFTLFVLFFILKLLVLTATLALL